MINESEYNAVQKSINTHEISLSIEKTLPFEINAGAFFTLRIRAFCSSGCNLKGQIVNILDQDGTTIKELSLITPQGKTYLTDQIAFKAPVISGKYTWFAVFPSQEKEGISHKKTSIPFTFFVKPYHIVSLAVWDAASPTVVNTKFRIMVGIRCSANCRLSGRDIEVCNQEGVKIAAKKLGQIPWPDTVALYWTEIELQAPAQDGPYKWQVRFPQDNDIYHLDTASSFSFRVVNPPACTVTIEVIESATQVPIKNALITLHPYRAMTDLNGMARLDIVQGHYRLHITGGDNKYEPFNTTVKATGDFTIKAELKASAQSNYG